jgi:hypothetical protein
MHITILSFNEKKRGGELPHRFIKYIYIYHASIPSNFT